MASPLLVIRCNTIRANRHLQLASERPQSENRSLKIKVADELHFFAAKLLQENVNAEGGRFKFEKG